MKPHISRCSPGNQTARHSEELPLVPLIKKDDWLEGQNHLSMYSAVRNGGAHCSDIYSLQKYIDTENISYIYSLPEYIHTEYISYISSDMTSLSYRRVFCLESQKIDGTEYLRDRPTSRLFL